MHHIYAMEYLDDFIEINIELQLQCYPTVARFLFFSSCSPLVPPYQPL